MLVFVKHLLNSIDMHYLSFTKVVCSTFVVFYTPFGNHLSHYFYTLIKKRKINDNYTKSKIDLQIKKPCFNWSILN